MGRIIRPPSKRPSRFATNICSGRPVTLLYSIAVPVRNHYFQLFSRPVTIFFSGRLNPQSLCLKATPVCYDFSSAHPVHYQYNQRSFLLAFIQTAVPDRFQYHQRSFRLLFKQPSRFANNIASVFFFFLTFIQIPVRYQYYQWSFRLAFIQAAVPVRYQYL